MFGYLENNLAGVDVPGAQLAQQILHHSWRLDGPGGKIDRHAQLSSAKLFRHEFETVCDNQPIDLDYLAGLLRHLDQLGRIAIKDVLVPAQQRFHPDYFFGFEIVDGLIVGNEIPAKKHRPDSVFQYAFSARFRFGFPDET